MSIFVRNDYKDVLWNSNCKDGNEGVRRVRNSNNVSGSMDCLWRGGVKIIGLGVLEIVI